MYLKIDVDRYTYQNDNISMNKLNKQAKCESGRISIEISVSHNFQNI